MPSKADANRCTGQYSAVWTSAVRCRLPGHWAGCKFPAIAATSSFSAPLSLLQNRAIDLVLWSSTCCSLRHRFVSQLDGKTAALVNAMTGNIVPIAHDLPYYGRCCSDILTCQETGPHLFEFSPAGTAFEYYAHSIGARSQSAKTYLEKNFESFEDGTSISVPHASYPRGCVGTPTKTRALPADI